MGSSVGAIEGIDDSDGQPGLKSTGLGGPERKTETLYPQYWLNTRQMVKEEKGRERGRKVGGGGGVRFKIL